MRTYACLAIAKGHLTQGHTWWPEIRPQFGRSAKTATFGGILRMPLYTFVPSSLRLKARVSRKEFC